jgi:hypothetical protein
MPRSICLSLLCALLAACSSTHHTGVANVASAQLDAPSGDLLVRPLEVAWRLGERTHFQATVDGATLGSFRSSGAVKAGGMALIAGLPNHVERAATDHLIARSADGYVVTNYVVETVSDSAGVTYNVEVWGHLLFLETLGLMSEERADLRRQLQHLESSGPTQSLSTSDLLGASSALMPRAPKPKTRNPNRLRFGFEVGPVAGLKLETGLPGTPLDALSMRLGLGAVRWDGFWELGVPAFAIQAEFLDGSLVQPVVGAATTQIPGYFDSTLIGQAVLGAEIDPAASGLEAMVGVRVGQMFDGGQSAITPDLTIGYIW